MKVFIIPIEPLVERYTESWYRNIPNYFNQAGVEVEVIDGTPLCNTVEVGTFLDINSTIAYKASQMQVIAGLFHNKKVKANDVFFITDIEFWGIEALRLLSQMNEIPIKIVGFLHAASYTIEDAFSVAAPYQKYTELGWLRACDLVFVGSGYHREAVIDRRINAFADPKDRPDLTSKLIVTGNPLFPGDYSEFDVKRKKKLILSNRFDYEKRPNISLDIAVILKNRMPDLEVVVCTSRPTFRSNRPWLTERARILEKEGVITILEGLTKNQYHEQLAESKLFLTNSIEENFGYCLIEACVYGVIPLAPDTCSHSEILNWNTKLLFTDEDDCIDKAVKILNKEYTVDPTQYSTPFYSSMSTIINHVRQLI